VAADELGDVERREQAVRQLAWRGRRFCRDVAVGIPRATSRDRSLNAGVAAGAVGAENACVTAAFARTYGGVAPFAKLARDVSVFVRQAGYFAV
jgi:hypothetical protein